MKNLLAMFRVLLAGSGRRTEVSVSLKVDSTAAPDSRSEERQRWRPAARRVNYASLFLSAVLGYLALQGDPRAIDAIADVLKPLLA